LVSIIISIGLNSSLNFGLFRVEVISFSIMSS